VVLDPHYQRLNTAAQLHALGAEDELMEVLAMASLNYQAGMDVGVDERVVEDCEFRQCAIPAPLPEHSLSRLAVAVQNHMRRVCGAILRRSLIRAGSSIASERRIAVRVVFPVRFLRRPAPAA